MPRLTSALPGTRIELADANTRAVFGDYTNVYDIQRAAQDGVSVPIYYESQLAKLVRRVRAAQDDPDFEQATTQGEEIERKEKLKTKWAQLEPVSVRKRGRAHWRNRTRD